MPTALYSIYATVGLHVPVPRMPVLQLYDSLKFAHHSFRNLAGKVDISIACHVMSCHVLHMDKRQLLIIINFAYKKDHFKLTVLNKPI